MVRENMIHMEMNIFKSKTPNFRLQCFPFKASLPTSEIRKLVFPGTRTLVYVAPAPHSISVRSYWPN